jgi:hypothetical protein
MLDQMDTYQFDVAVMAPASPDPRLRPPSLRIAVRL